MTKRSTSIALGPEMDALVRHLQESGGYANASEVIRAGLRALEAQTLRRQLTQLCACADEVEKVELSSTIWHLALLVESVGERPLAEKMRSVALVLSGKPNKAALSALRRSGK